MNPITLTLARSCSARSSERMRKSWVAEEGMVRAWVAEEGMLRARATAGRRHVSSMCRGWPEAPRRCHCGLSG